MNLVVFGLGLAKLLFAVVVAGLGTIFAARLLKRLLDIRTDEAVQRGNVAVGVVKAAALIALALLARAAVEATFDAVDLTLQAPQVNPKHLGVLAIYAVAHLVLTLLVGIALLVIAIFVFNRITPGVDEVAEVRQGNVAAGVVLGAVVVVVALLAAPALEAALNGLLPFPELPGKFPS
ncbi:MAG: DUF350 domain-containing protein [Myxococcaceae bacterium]|nr:DUF350 domain-containing protein [Myxococcaceae bacterium]